MLTNVVAPVGLILILLATASVFFLMNVDWAQKAYPFVYSAGALLVLVSRLFSPYRGSDLKLRRLHRIEGWSGIFFCAAVFFLFYNQGQLRDWLAFTLAGAAIQIFTSIAIPAREIKLDKEKDSGKENR